MRGRGEAVILQGGFLVHVSVVNFDLVCSSQVCAMGDQLVSVCVLIGGLVWCRCRGRGVLMGGMRGDDFNVVSILEYGCCAFSPATYQRWLNGNE